MCKQSDVNEYENENSGDEQIAHFFHYGDAHHEANELMMQLAHIYLVTDIELVLPFAEEWPIMNMHYILSDFHIKEDAGSKATTNTCMFAARWEDVRENVYYSCLFRKKFKSINRC